MRLKEHEVAAIKATAQAVFGTDVIVRLFGSRVHDELRGGDIDLHFEMSTMPDYIKRAEFLDLIDEAVDGRKVDTVFSERGTISRGFERIAYRDGIVL